MERPEDQPRAEDELREEDVTKADRLDDRVQEDEGLPAQSPGDRDE